MDCQNLRATTTVSQASHFGISNLFLLVTHSHAVQLHNWALCLPLLDLLHFHSFTRCLFIWTFDLFIHAIYSAFSDCSIISSRAFRLEHLHIFLFKESIREEGSFRFVEILFSRSTRYILQAFPSLLHFLASCVMQFARGTFQRSDRVKTKGHTCMEFYNVDSLEILRRCCRRERNSLESERTNGRMNENTG